MIVSFRFVGVKCYLASWGERKAGKSMRILSTVFVLERFFCCKRNSSVIFPFRLVILLLRWGKNIIRAPWGEWKTRRRRILFAVFVVVRVSSCMWI